MGGTMNLPKTVKIGAITYAVQFLDQLRNDDGESLAGQYLAHTKQIRLVKGMDDDITTQVFWHEVLHSILEQTGHEHNEGLINALSYGLIAMFEANGWRIET